MTETITHRPDRTGLWVIVPMVLAGAAGVGVSLAMGATLFAPFAAVFILVGLYCEWLRRQPAPTGGYAEPVPMSEVDKLFVFGVVSGLLFPVLGFVVGLVLLSKDAGPGIRVIVVSIGAALIWALIWTMILF